MPVHTVLFNDKEAASDIYIYFFPLKLKLLSVVLYFFPKVYPVMKAILCCDLLTYYFFYCEDVSPDDAVLVFFELMREAHGLLKTVLCGKLR